jgi:hypothetical protein
VAAMPPIRLKRDLMARPLWLERSGARLLDIGCGNGPLSGRRAPGVGMRKDWIPIRVRQQLVGRRACLLQWEACLRSATPMPALPR